jgi:hypothetical protein
MKNHACSTSAISLLVALATVTGLGCAAPPDDESASVDESDLAAGEAYVVDAVAVRRLRDTRTTPPDVLADPAFWRGERTWSPPPLGEPLEKSLGAARVTFAIRSFQFDARTSENDTFRADVRIAHPRIDGQPGTETTLHRDVLFTRQTNGGYNDPGFWGTALGSPFGARLAFASDALGRRANGRPTSGPETLTSFAMTRRLGALVPNAEAWLELRSTTPMPLRAR